MTNGFDFSKAVVKPQPEQVAKPAEQQQPEAKPQQPATTQTAVQPAVAPLAIKAVKLAVEAKPKPIVQSAPTAILEGLDQLGDLPKPISYKEALAEMPSLDELANEFNNPDQPEEFDDAALAAVHKACLQLESAIDNAEEVRTQLTFIMTELRKYPETAAKIWDSDMATMVKSLRHNYNVVAFAKAANKKAKAEKASRVNDMLAAADASGLFDGLEL